MPVDPAEKTDEAVEAAGEAEEEAVAEPPAKRRNTVTPQAAEDRFIGYAEYKQRTMSWTRATAFRRAQQLRPDVFGHVPVDSTRKWRARPAVDGRGRPTVYPLRWSHIWQRC